MMLSSRSLFLAVTLIATVLQPVLAQSPTQKQIQACANSIILETYESPVTYYTDDTTHFFNATYSYNPALCVSPRVPINRLYLANLVSGTNLNCPITQFTSSGLTSTQCSRSFADMAVAAQDGNTDWNIVIQVGVRPTLYTIDNEFTVVGSDPPPPPPVPSGRKRHFRRKAGPDLHCQIGESFCWTGAGRDFACMDTSSDVTACGSCPFDEDAIDCTSIPGVSDVQCRQSNCYVSKCERGYQVSSDRTTCARTAETIPTRYWLR